MDRLSNKVATSVPICRCISVAQKNAYLTAGAHSEPRDPLSGFEERGGLGREA